MKTIGIIGGLGPETTSKFYLEIVSLCRKVNQISYPHILINSIPLPFSIEENAIANGVGEEKCLPYLLDAAKSLEKAGADFLVLPCNSLHIFIDDIRSAVRIPVLSILEETAQFLESQGVEKVGVLATSITIKNKLYEKLFKQNGITQIIPNNIQQSKIGKVIYNIVSNMYDNKDREILLKIIQDFSKDEIQHVILACTDLQLLMPKHREVKIYDTMKILADAAVREINNI